MNTPTIGSIRPVPGQGGGHAADHDATRGTPAWLRGPRLLEPSLKPSFKPSLKPLLPPSLQRLGQPVQALRPAALAHAPLRGGAELLLNLAVRPAYAAAWAHGTQAHDKMLRETLALLASLAHDDADPAVAQARQILHEHAALRALAVDYRSALQAG